MHSGEKGKLDGWQKRMKLRAWGTLRRLPSGKWQASYVGPDLTRHTAPITYTARMDAEH